MASFLLLGALAAPFAVAAPQAPSALTYAPEAFGPAAPTTAPVSAPIAAPSVLTRVVASPGGKPIDITSQSQVVTSFLPQYTICYTNQTAYSSLLQNAPAAAVPLPSTTCSTAFMTTVTPICATDLIGIGSTVRISRCDQAVTFSSAVDYSVYIPDATPTATHAADAAHSTGYASSNISITYPPACVKNGVLPTPSVHALNTYFIAPWTDLVGGQTPPNVTVRACSPAAATTTCVDALEKWEVVPHTSVTTNVTDIQIATSVPGSAVLKIDGHATQVVDDAVTVSEKIVIASTYVDMSTRRSPWSSEAAATGNGAASLNTAAATLTRTQNLVYAPSATWVLAPESTVLAAPGQASASFLPAYPVPYGSSAPESSTQRTTSTIRITRTVPLTVTLTRSRTSDRSAAPFLSVSLYGPQAADAVPTHARHRRTY